MQSAPPPSPLHPALLPLGTQVGPWSVVGWVGQGVHGAVYRAVRLATWAGWMTRGAFPLAPEVPPRTSQAAHPTAREDLPEAEPSEGQA